ncbi:hypothetical protein KI387_038817 [Taxus chinensis]|uniref:SPX domain-containing protein n=1 Tax=Taxus chinensis TaxID=29808 RepID=A0AA38CE92_TAXCH|nr:hypothetical protein KI387_038817 [Taxus chinensis]
MIEEAPPEWQDKFLSYKQLKKRLKLLSPGVEQREAEAEEKAEVKDDGEAEGEAESGAKEASEGRRKRRRIETQGVGEGTSGSSTNGYGIDLGNFNYNLTVEEADFIQLLNPELEKFNLFFMEKEEEYIIRQKEVQERIARVKDTYGPSGACPSKANYKHDMINVRKDIVNFHGEMVLLENYSVLNYTGLVKILKKYDKRRGGCLRLAFIQKVLEEPFFRMELLYKLVKECEESIEHLFAKEEEEEELEAVYAGEDQGMYRSTLAALRSMREMRKGSSTYTALSLPPLHDNPSGSTVFTPPIFPQG